ncbi:hypothetical protein [Variovorax sp. UC74_104]|uniref:hypothetical protein n=1 Tax=Variovorax sp. UC74_104 TaxID=3374555 RepID=UPI003757304E
MADQNTPANENAERDDTSSDTSSKKHNKAGNQPLTPRNEPNRTPESRHDRESHVGSGNQTQARRGGATR